MIGFVASSDGALNVHSYSIPIALWVILAAIAVVCISIEVHHMKRDHEIELGEATRYTLFYIGLAVAFGVAVIAFVGGQAGSEYYAAWAIEKALSLDNLFVMGIVFAAFEVPHRLERRMLNYGIAGAIVFRLVFIVVGLELMKRLEPIMIVFGIILALGAYKAFKGAISDEQELDPKNTRTWRFLSRKFNIINEYDGHKVRVVRDGKKYWLLMVPVIAVIEAQDIVFAVDSVPAVLAVSPDRFIAFSSNLMAILGLRALYFVYQNVAERFWAIGFGVSLILAWIAFKMFVTPDELFGLPWFGIHVPVGISLGVLAVLLFGSIAVSLTFKKPAGSHIHVPDADPVTTEA